MQDEKLVDHVKRSRDDENLADGLPPIPQLVSPTCWIGEECPEIGGLFPVCVFQSVVHGEERGHDRLQVETHRHRAGWPCSDLMPDSSQRIVHRVLCTGLPFQSGALLPTDGSRPLSVRRASWMSPPS